MTVIYSRLHASSVSAARTARRCLSSSASSPLVSSPSASAAPNELLHLILQQIRAHGPMSVSRYMSYCLGHPTLGYYARTRDQASSTVLGKQGDFITSPEISQVFGELIAIWFIAQWQAQGMPKNCRIVELGPGKGTLMSDMMRTFNQIKPFGDALRSVHLVETSQYFRSEQKKALEAQMQGTDIALDWHNTAQDVPISSDEKQFTAVIAHEFFDALPIHIFERKPEGWREVAIDEGRSEIIVSGRPRNKLRYVVSPSPNAASQLYTKSPRFEKLSTGTRVEVCPEAYTAAGQMSRLVAKGGAGLMIDYGDARTFGNSFRGFRGHQIVDALSEAGQTDLTANVDFDFLSEAANSQSQSSQLLTQRDFLQKMGLEVRVKNLLKSASEKRQGLINAATERLIDQTGMGKQYKVMAVTPQGLASPYPFDA